VDAVVEGTVLRSGNPGTDHGELVQVATDRHLWAEPYESQLGDVLDSRGQVASAIVNEIRVNLSPEEQQRLASARTVTGESYENYLKGSILLEQEIAGRTNKAIEYFQLAIEKGSKLCAGLRWPRRLSYSIIGSRFVGTVPFSGRSAQSQGRGGEGVATGMTQTRRSRKRSLATVRLITIGIWAGAASGFQRSIALIQATPQLISATLLYLMAMGRRTKSLCADDAREELDPLSISMNFSLGWRLYMARKYDQAIEQLQNTLEMVRTSPCLAWFSLRPTSRRTLTHKPLRASESCRHLGTTVRRCSERWGMPMALQATGPG